MIRTIIFVLALVFSQSSLSSWQQQPPLPVNSCQVHGPYGFPKVNRELIPLCRQGYISAYDAQAKIPAWVAYTLTPQNALGCVARDDNFIADRSIKNGPTPQDYANTGFDKGHMAPNGDLSWSQNAMYESFLMTNMTPQAPSLNRGIWKLLETSVRGWAVQRNQTYNIITGAVYGPNNTKIGNGVVVPNALYKVVINTDTREYAAWMFPHVPPYPNLGTDMTKYRISVSQLQTQTGVMISLPGNSKELNPGQEWPVDFGRLTSAKSSKCK